MTIGDRIKQARLEHGLTQAELGKLCGVGKGAISKYEKGVVSNIKRSTLQKLSNALGLKGSDLVIEYDPESEAEFHARVLQDAVVLDMIEKYYTLTDEQQSLIRDMINTLSPKE